MRIFTRMLAPAMALAALAWSSSSGAVEFVIYNGDDPGVGFNDMTPATPVGGNKGTTVGQQRINAYLRAFELWGAVLTSPEQVYVYAYWFEPTPAQCTPTTGVLGSAGTTYIFSDFPGAPLEGHWYHSALADKLAGSDLLEPDVGPGYPDMITQFNNNLGSPGCLETSSWYYGFDNNEAPGQIDFLAVLMHEVAHGLGFSNFTSEGSGAFLAGVPDVYTAFTRDNITGKQWDDPTMTNADRAASGKSIDKMVWNGANVVATAANVLASPYVGVEFTAPASVAGRYDYGTAAFGPAATPANFAGDAVYAEDGVGATNDGCTTLTNGAAIAGQIALVDRGTCTFAIKTKNAQDAGATGVVLVNNTEAIAGLGGSDPSITIPTISVLKSIGDKIKVAGGTASLFLFSDANRKMGADAAGNPRLYAPSVYASGSSGSHFDVTATPNALMEPAINSDLRSATNVDMTAAEFKDIGWDIANFSIAGCDAGVPAVTSSGDVLIGPVLHCLDGAGTKGQFQSCTTQYLTGLNKAGLISNTAKGLLTNCAARLK